VANICSTTAKPSPLPAGKTGDHVYYYWAVQMHISRIIFRLQCICNATVARGTMPMLVRYNKGFSSLLVACASMLGEVWFFSRFYFGKGKGYQMGREDD
jgi:hypothetical protein